MNTRLGQYLATLVGCSVLTGCGDARPSGSGSRPGATNAGGSGNPLTAPVDYLGAVGNAQKRSEQVLDLTTLKQAVQAFQAGEDRLPATLQELVTEGYLPRLPVPPRGMQFAYQPHSGQVRVVPAPAPVPASTSGAGAGTPRR